MQMIEASKKNNYPVFWTLVFPVVMLLWVLLTDHFFFNGVMLTPTCNFVTLAILALKLKPGPMVCWAVLFLLSSLFVLSHPDFAMLRHVETGANLFVRSVGAVTGAIVTVFLCINRTRLMKDHEQMLQLLKRMPVPFVLSDEHGEVLFINEQAAALLKLTSAEAQGDSYFSLLKNTLAKGTSIQSYLSTFDSMSEKEIVSKFRPRTNPDQMLDGHSILVETAGVRRMVTILSPAEES